MGEPDVAGSEGFADLEQDSDFPKPVVIGFLGIEGAMPFRVFPEALDHQ